MPDWEKQFPDYRLNPGKTLYLGNHVQYLNKNGDIYSATVTGKSTQKVRIVFQGEKIKSMSCGCPLSKIGNSCEHMAAVLYAIEAEQQAQEKQVSEQEIQRGWIQERLILQEAEKKEAQEKKTKNTSGNTETSDRTPKVSREKKERPEKKPTRKELAELRKKEKEAEQERLRLEAQKAEEEANRLLVEQEERDRKRAERDKRKQERAAKEAESKRRAEELREAENAKRRAEEERREKLREQKALEAQKKAEKKRQQEEATRQAEIRKQEEAARAAQEQRKREEQERKQEQKRQVEERKRKAEEQKKRDQEQRRRQEEERMLRETEELRQKKREDRKTRFEILGDNWESETETLENSAALEELAAYRYYNAEKIRASMPMPKEIEIKGEKLLNNGRLTIDGITSGYMHPTNEVAGEISGTGTSRGNKYHVNLLFTRDSVVQHQCDCPECRRYYYRWDDSVCEYQAGLMIYLSRYLEQKNLGDATDRSARRLLDRYRTTGSPEKRITGGQKEKQQQLVPRLIKKEGSLSLTFKFGEDKLYVIKNLDEFCEHMEKGEEGTYGTKTQLIHNKEQLTDSSRSWYQMLKQMLQEERRINEKVMEASYYYRKDATVGNSLELFGWRLDQVYEKLKEGPVDYEDWDQATKVKGSLNCGEQKAKLSLTISPNPSKKGKEFHGIHLKMNFPEMFSGTDTMYFLNQNTLNRMEPEYFRTIQPLYESAEEDTGNLNLDIGRNSLSDFYHHVLPEIRKSVSVTELQAERIHSYLIPEARYFFYLDANRDEVFAEAAVQYGNREYDLLELLENPGRKDMEEFRDEAGEEKVLTVLLKYLNCYDREAHFLHNNGEEEAAYNLYAYGIQELNEYGEVHCTRKFRDSRKLKKVKMSIGVSVSEGMLDLSITTQDVSESELLEILKSYRRKKQYFRLKDGSFVDLQDTNLDTMAEMVETLHLTKEDLRKKSLKLPLYRSLYLDRLLEANEELYEDRDRTIRRMASQFRSIENTEYEVPQSLKKIMRSYQKDGFKWLKTLDQWGFGGILADEMGLGKTLQTISLLLSAKEEGREGVSLIVCPASLVYNWEEEMHRFAPGLEVKTVTGNQAERSRIIEEQNCDVLVTSYDLLRRDIPLYEEKTFLFQIIDEAQYIKNHTTAAAKAVKVIHSTRRYALTGTPVENRLSELWSIFDYLMPGFLYGYETFRKEYEIPIVKNEEEDRMNRLQRQTGPFILRRKKTDVLKDLPEKLEEVRYVRLAEEQRLLYDGQVVEFRNQIQMQSEQEFNQSKIKILAELTRLRQICCDPSMCFENYHGETAKTEACMDLIRGAMDAGHRMLVFSQFTSMLDILKARLEQEGVPCYMLTGSTSKEERIELVRQFNEGDTPVFLISLKAGGVGLNLTGADIVIHYDPWWNIAAQNQATDRAHRIGQKKKVTVYKLIAKGTIEESILQLQEKKKELADQILNGESGQLGALGREEILEMLAEE